MSATQKHTHTRMLICTCRVESICVFINRFVAIQWTFQCDVTSKEEGKKRVQSNQMYWLIFFEVDGFNPIL